MDSLAEKHAVIVRDEKTLRIPYGDEVLIVQFTTIATNRRRLSDATPHHLISTPQPPKSPPPRHNHDHATSISPPPSTTVSATTYGWVWVAANPAKSASGL
nr:hypothetical protein [Tanacetum cinerariifolium]